MVKGAMGAFVVVVAVAWSCSGGGPSGPAGGPVSGAMDTHCGMRVQPTSQADCKVSGSGATGLGDTMYNSEGDDDDCKYHVKFTVSPVYENSDVNFTVTPTKKTDGTPAVGANVDPEVFLDTKHPAPNSSTHTTESPPGTYHVGPIHFDEAGKWTVRFHFFEQCDDSIPTSPHGHAAFFIDVP